MNQIALNRYFPLLTFIWVGFPLLWVVPHWIVLFTCGLIMTAGVAQASGTQINRRRFFRLGVLPAVLLVLIQYRTLLRYEPAMAVVLLGTAFKLNVYQEVRDLRHAAMMMLILVAGITLNSQSIPIVIHVLLSFLWIGMILLETSKGRIAFEGIFASGVQVMTYFLMAMPIIAVIYLFFPRYEEALFSIYHFKGHGRTGISGEVYPGIVSELIEDEALVFRAYLDQPVPVKNLYWRILTLSYTDGNKWRESVLDREDGALPAGDAEDVPAVTQKILLEPLLKRYLAGLDMPIAMDSPTNPEMVISGAGSQTFRSKRDAVTREQYLVRSYLHPLVGAGASPEKLYRFIPDQLSNDVRRLVTDWQRENSSDEEYLQNILKYFSRHLSYTLTPGEYDRDEDFLHQLFFDVKKGFCEHFASAFALLARVQGIPTRLVVGYQGGSYNPYGGYWVVRQKNAHVWTEVFLRQKGWTRIDPTYFVQPERIINGQYDYQSDRWLAHLPFYDVFKALGLRLDAANTKWNQWLTAVSFAWQKRLFQGGMQVRLKRYQIIGIVTFGGVMAVYLLGFAFQTVWRQLLDDDLDAQLVKSYQKTLRKIASRDIFKAPHEGPLGFLNRIEAADSVLFSRVAPILNTYIQLRYGPGPVSKNDVQALRKMVRRLRF